MTIWVRNFADPRYERYENETTPLYYMQDITLELQDDLNVIPEAQNLVNDAVKRRYGQ